jgi:3-deoxy-D-manno-octulosonic-acid transferase
VFLLYNFLMTITSPIWVPMMLWRASRRKEKVNWKERQGDYEIKPRKDRRRIWIHAVSVGEVMASLPILKRVRDKLPEFEIVLSVTTSTGHAVAAQHAMQWADYLFYFPIDTPRNQLAAMSRVQPALVAIMETELWMNFLWAAKAVGARTMLINGRISDRSFKRSKIVRPMLKAIARQVDRALMQSETDAERVRAYGAPEVEVVGNSKFDAELSGQSRDWRKELNLDPAKLTLVIGSTRGEEEERFVLQAIEDIDRRELLIIHAPRHLEDIEALAQRIGQAIGRPALRSKGETGPYLLLDSYGELGEIYAIADIVVIGGGFAPKGGQNLIQPLALGKPVIHGPNMQNFRFAADEAHAAGATIVAHTPEELRSALESLLSDPAKRAQMGAAGQALVARHRGASERYAEEIAREAAARAAEIAR